MMIKLNGNRGWVNLRMVESIRGESIRLSSGGGGVARERGFGERTELRFASGEKVLVDGSPEHWAKVVGEVVDD